MINICKIDKKRATQTSAQSEQTQAQTQSQVQITPRQTLQTSLPTSPQAHTTQTAQVASNQGVFGDVLTNRAVKRIATKVLAVALTIVLCVSFGPSAALAAPSDVKKAEADAARAQLEQVQNDLNQASDDYYTAMADHDAAVERMNQEKATLEVLNAKIAESKSTLSNRAVSMYRNDRASMMDVLLGSTSFKDFTNTWNFLVTLNEDTSELIQEGKTLRQQSEAALAEYQNQEQVAAQKLTEAEQVKANAEVLVADYQQKVNSLDAEVKALIEQEKAEEEARAQREWQRQQAAAAAAAAARNRSTSGSNSGSSAGSTSDSTAYTAPVTTSGTRADIVNAAYSKLGCPYVWGATGPNTFDCSGLTSWCYRQAGISIPRTSGAQRSGGTRISLSEAEPGDILWMSGHVGIYIGNGQYIHAPTTGDVVKIASNMGMWSCAVRY